MLAVSKNLHAVHENVFYTDGVLVRFLERRPIGDGRGIEENDISEHSFFNETAVIKTEIGGGQPAQSSDRLSHRDYFLVTHIFAENARKIAVGARMRIRF